MKLTETQKAEEPEEQRRKAEEALESVSEVDLISYTDGSAGGMTRGGADIVTYRGGSDGEEVKLTNRGLVQLLWSRAHSTYCGDEVARAGGGGVEVTDSRSLAEALQMGGVERRLSLLSERMWRLEAQNHAAVGAGPLWSGRQ